MISLIVAGLGVGFLVGLTGVGGGSLMTPILVLLFGHAPATAVGTDLFFASGTKAVGTTVHHRASGVDWRVVGLLAAGSLPAAGITLVASWAAHASATRDGLVMALLGSLIVLTGAHSLGLLGWRPAAGQRLDPGVRWPALTVAGGALLGTLVTLTSIGAGALGVVLLRALYPRRLSAPAVVGTDLAHAIPLTLLAGAGYLSLGSIDLPTLGWLLCGSVPGVLAGSLLPARLQEQTVRRVMGALLLVVGTKTLASAFG